MASVPRLRGDKEPEYITGQPPSLLDLPTGCRFAERCPRGSSIATGAGLFTRIGDRLVKCWLYA